jgi:predicted membrane protein
MKSQPKKTLLIIAIGLSILNIFVQNIGLIIIAFLLLFIAFSSKKISLFIESYWFKLSKVLAFISNRILLGMIFFIILTPIALAYRMFKRQKKKNQESFYVEYDKTFKPEDLKNTW